MEILSPVGEEEKIVARVAAFDLAGAGPAELFAGVDDVFGSDGAAEKRARGAATAEDRDDKGFFGW